MRIKKQTICMITALLLCSSGFSSFANEKEDVGENRLPKLLIGYAQDVGYGLEATCLDKNHAGKGVCKIQDALQANLTKVDPNLPLKLAFVNEAYIFQPDIVGNRVVGKKRLAPCTLAHLFLL